MTLRISLFFILGLSLNTALAVETTPSKRVLMISCDGLRPDAIPAADTPVLQRLIETGSYQSTALAELPPVTLPNHASMVTGKSVENHGVWFNFDQPGRISAQTIFDVAKAAGLNVGFFASKSKLSYLCEEDSVDAWNITSNEDVLTDQIVDAIASHDLHLMFVHFGEPDGTGHRQGWMSTAYLEQVAHMDALIGRVLDALNEKCILDQTLVIVTSDHGGHDQTHFLNIPEDRFIPFILNGPDIAAGRTLCEQVRVMDAAATALAFLDLPIDVAADGRVVTEASIDIAYAECEPAIPLLGFPCGPLTALLMLPMVVMVRRRGGLR